MEEFPRQLYVVLHLFKAHFLVRTLTDNRRQHNMLKIAENQLYLKKKKET